MVGAANMTVCHILLFYAKWDGVTSSSLLPCRVSECIAIIALSVWISSFPITLCYRKYILEEKIYTSENCNIGSTVAFLWSCVVT